MKNVLPYWFLYCAAKIESEVKNLLFKDTQVYEHVIYIFMCIAKYTNEQKTTAEVEVERLN